MTKKEPKEKIAPRTCVCGETACIVKHKSKIMACCPNSTRCAMRTSWYTTEDAAIKSWNIQIEEAQARNRKK